jgi:EAL domain-containing protein (putative c-di-GMP-specific phosphodiesterase class I)
MDVEERDRQLLAEALSLAPERGELRLDYQPIVGLVSGQAVAVEALVRWQHPRRGLLGPDAFIGLAEQQGSIGSIGRWVLREAAVQVAAWNRARPLQAGLTLHVNASAKELVDPDYASGVVSILKATGLDPHRLVIEVTETDLITDIDNAGATLTRLRTGGVQVALDDFGTGYSSLSHLRRFPIDVLKIDRSFVTHLGAGGDDCAIVRAIAALAHALDLEVIVEGVETAAQAAEAHALGCGSAQGYYFARPATATAIETLIRPASAAP